jgi:uncharacterized membrane protein YkvA (DUF1232 family)
MLSSLRAKAKKLESETYALYLAYRDPRTPWHARALSAFVIAHTVSPIDLIPDFIPVIGYLDDFVITPLGLYLALRMIPPEVLADARRQAARASTEGGIKTRAGVAIVLSVWAFGAIVLVVILARLIQK